MIIFFSNTQLTFIGFNTFGILTKLMEKMLNFFDTAGRIGMGEE